MKIHKITKSFGENKVLDNFSAEIPDGEITCIMGRSGCGKSTLLNIIMGLTAPDSGSIEQSGNISTVFQEDRLCSRLSAAANVKLVCPKSVTEESIAESLLAVGLEKDDLFRPVSELSGGMKRRTAIVRAVMAESDIIIMDEAFKGLDSATKKLTAEYVLANRNDRTLIFVTHDKEEIALLGGRLIEIKEAKDE